MKRRTKVKATLPAGGELAQQKSEFTAEGAPPPGRVALDVPVMPVTSAETKKREPGSCDEFA